MITALKHSIQKMNRISESKKITKEDALFIIEYIEHIRSAIQNHPNHIDRIQDWIVISGKKRFNALTYWSKGVWLEDSDGDYLTGMIHSLYINSFTKNNIRVSNSIRIKIKKNNSDLKKAKQLKEFENLISANYYQKKTINKEIEKLKKHKYKWIDADTFIKYNKNNIIECLGATIN